MKINLTFSIFLDELDKLENHIKTGKPHEFIRNCFCCIQPDFVEMCKEGRTVIVKWMIEHGANVHARDDVALCWASENNHIEIAKLLLAAGANVHARDDLALRWASENNHIEIAKLLLAAGADVHADDDYALRWASHNGHSEVVKVLQDWIGE